MHKKHIISAVKFAVLLAIIVISIAIYIANMSTGFGLQSFKDIVLSYGSSAWIVMFLLIVIFISIGLPVVIPLALTSILFSMLHASLMLCIGIYIGTSFAFFIARWLGKDYVEETFIKKSRLLKSFDKKLHRHGLYTILVSRFIFFIPFELTNFAAGVSRVRFRDYFIGTVIGATPGTLLSIYLMKELHSIYSLKFAAASAIFLLLIVIPLLSKRIRKAVL